MSSPLHCCYTGAKIQKMTKLGTLLTRKHLEWQIATGERKTVEEFAAHLGISRPLLTMWMNGTRRPGPGNIKLLFDLFGPEIYDALGLPRPDPFVEYVTVPTSQRPSGPPPYRHIISIRFETSTKRPR